MNLKIKMSVDTSCPEQVGGLINFLQGLNGKETKSPSKETPVSPLQDFLSKQGFPSVKEKPSKKEKTEKEPEVDQKAANKTEVEDPKEITNIKTEEVRALVSAKAADNRKEIKAELTRLKASNVTSLDKKHYEEFVEFLKAL